ncbi:hypothetical protein, partial [Pseudomonas syringae]
LAAIEAPGKGYVFQGQGQMNIRGRFSALTLDNTFKTSCVLKGIAGAIPEYRLDTTHGFKHRQYTIVHARQSSSSWYGNPYWPDFSPSKDRTPRA